MSRVQTINEIKGKLTPIFDAYGVRSAILFGSVAKGTSTEKSDIDLLVDSRLDQNIHSNFLRQEQPLQGFQSSVGRYLPSAGRTLR